MFKYFQKNKIYNDFPVFIERQRCALWIRKLCEPSGTGTGTMGRKNRNLYAKLLLHMLQRGVLEGPFTQRPEPGTLKTLPSYMVGITECKYVSFISAQVRLLTLSVGNGDITDFCALGGTLVNIDFASL